MRKLFTLTLALLASFSLWAETVTMDCALAKGSTPSPSIGVALLNGGAFDGSGYKLGSDGNYIGWNISAANRTFSAITFNGYINTTNTEKNWGFQFSTDGGTTWGAEVTQANDGTKSYHDINVSVSIPSGANAVRIIRRAGTSSYVSSITLTLTPDCQSPANALVLSADKTSDIYEGDEITFSTTGGNGGAITLEGSDSESITDSVWVATVGEHTFTASQAKNGDYCAQESELILNVVAAEAVEEVSIAGATSAYVGAELTYTATADNATAYEWYLDGVKQGSDSAKFIYTAVKGNHTIYATATNAYTTTPVASDTIALTVTTVSGTLITVAQNGQNTANVTSGAFTGTGEGSLSSSETSEYGGKTGRKLNTNGTFLGVTSLSGVLLEGDTAIIFVTTTSTNLALYADKTATTKIGEMLGGVVQGENKIVLNENATGVSAFYLLRHANGVQNMNPYVAYISIVRPKEVKSTAVTLTNVKIDGEAISSANLTTLLADESLDIAESYLDAPEVKFYKNIRTTFEDDTYSDKLDSIVVTSTTEAGKWQAQATINEVEYTVTMAKTASYVVTYMFGSTELGTENVVTNGNPANYETYQTLNDGNLSTFGGWYSKSDLSGDAVTIASATITKDTTFYASFTYKYATSVNMENFAKNNAKGETNSEALISSLGTHKYASNISYVSGTNEIDSLRADRITGDRNYPYLGLKVKTSGALINFRLEEGKTVKVKFGNVGATPLVSINGGEYAAMTITNSVYTYTATVDGELVSIKTASAAAVVFQQIAIDEELANPELFAVTCAAAENGTVTSNRQFGIPGETVTLTLAPADGYKVASVTVNGGDPLTVSENTATFTMPAADANVVATFSVATALDNTADEIKAVKFIENGQLFIRRGEKVYTITGEEVK